MISLKGKCVVLGVTGSIAAFKIASLASMLVKAGADVEVIMTKNATNFINPITFETLTHNRCITDTFDRAHEYNVEHISLAKKADVFLVAPATANVIGKIASGIADDMLTTTIMACNCKKLISPAMNTGMFYNPIVKDNISKLKAYGYEIISPDSGFLACGDTGDGRMPEPEVLFQYIVKETVFAKDLLGKTALVTAGPTREAIDPVRFITNHSTGKMGYALAYNLAMRGAEVRLVSGPVSISAPPFVDLINVESAADMAEAVKEYAYSSDIIIKAAAVADYRPSEPSTEKIKKTDGDAVIRLERTEDILAYLGVNKRADQFICGFSMETENLLENSVAKLHRKNVDMIVANSLKTPGAGFGTDTNVVTIITEAGVKELPLMSKDEVAGAIVDEILRKIS